MARIEEDREDLFAEATAYVLRGEIQWAGQSDPVQADPVQADPVQADPVFVGCKATGQFSFYFGADPVYQFDSQGRLRRAYLSGKLYRTQGSELACLTRVRTETETILERRDLSSDSFESIQNQMLKELKTLSEGLQTGQAEVLRSTISADEFQKKVSELCQRVFEQPSFLAPRIPGKR